MALSLRPTLYLALCCPECDQPFSSPEHATGQRSKLQRQCCGSCGRWYIGPPIEAEPEAEAPATKRTANQKPTSPRLRKRADGWWIEGLPEDTPDCGPYETKAEADDDRRGLERFFNNREETEGMIDTREKALSAMRNYTP